MLHSTQLVIVLLLVFGLLFQTAEAQAVAGSNQTETGWSNGAWVNPENPSIPDTLCPHGSFIQAWLVGEADVASSVGPLLSVVSVQGQCSDGSFLPALSSATSASKKHDYGSDSSLRSSSGYTCAQLRGYNNGGNWMMNFLGTGQDLADDAAGTPLKLKCEQVPPAYVAVGYSGVARSAVDALKFIMAPLPQPSSSPSPSPVASPTLSPAPSPVTSPSPAAAPQAPSPSPASSQSPLSMGAIIGIAGSALVGVSALFTIAYNAWKWLNKHKLVAAKGQGDVAPQGSAHSAAVAKLPPV